MEDCDCSDPSPDNHLCAGIYRLTDGRWALPPTCLEHHLPRLNGVVPQHPSASLGDWVVGWSPMEGSQQHPLTMSRWCIGQKMDDLLLVAVDQPTLTTCFLGLVV